jgi:hypothetical protein
MIVAYRPVRPPAITRTARSRRPASLVAAAATGTIVEVLAALVLVLAGGRGHRLSHEVVDELRVDLQDQLAKDQVVEMALGDEFLEVGPVRPEVGQR